MVLASLELSLDFSLDHKEDLLIQLLFHFNSHIFGHSVKDFMANVGDGDQYNILLSQQVILLNSDFLDRVQHEVRKILLVVSSGSLDFDQELGDLLFHFI